MFLKIPLVLNKKRSYVLHLFQREIERLPAPYGDCTETFRDSPFSAILKEWDDEYLTDREYYTYEVRKTVPYFFLYRLFVKVSP